MNDQERLEQYEEILQRITEEIKDLDRRVARLEEQRVLA